MHEHNVGNDVTVLMCSIMITSYYFFYKVFSGGMSTESAEWTITSLSKILDTMLMSSDKLISLNVLQQMSVLLEALTSLIPTQSHIELHEASDSRSTIRHCSNVADLEGILCKLQIKVISGI